MRPVQNDCDFREIFQIFPKSILILKILGGAYMPPPHHLFFLKGPHYKGFKELPSLQLRLTLGVSTLSIKF